MRIGGRGPSLGAVLLLVALVAILAGGGEDDVNRERDERPAKEADRERAKGGKRGGRARAGGDGGDGPAGEQPGRRARVVDVVDGDTIKVAIDGEVESLRYIGVDTPESVAPGQPVECFGKEASRENEKLVGETTVRLVFDAERRDHYGRLLAYVYAGETLVNAELVRRGYARTLEIAPNTSRAPQLRRLEAEAGRKGRGLWEACGP